MKLLLTALVCLLLAGCTPQPEPPVSAESPVPAPAPVPQSTAYGTAVTALSFPVGHVRQLFPFGDGFLLEARDRLLLLDSSLLPLAQQDRKADSCVRVCGEQITVFDPSAGELLLLDSRLCEHRRITLPPELVGEPVLSRDGRLLYYCTRQGIYGWDLDSGIRRRIRAISGTEISPVALHREGQILQCRSAGRDLFLDTADGRLLLEMEVPVSLFTQEDRYYCSYTSGSIQNLIFGSTDGSPMALFPEELSGQGQFLPGPEAAVTLTLRSDGKARLDLYDLNTGFLRDTLVLESAHVPTSVVWGGDCVVLLVKEDDACLILRWQPGPLPSGGPLHTAPHYTADSPDHAGLSLCRDYAGRISETFGVEVLIWKDAVAEEPWDYRFEPEHQASVILQQLQTLEENFSRYPESLLGDTADHFDTLRICLVRRISPVTESLGPADPTGIQFFSENRACIVLAAGEYMGQALYHELFHVMETHILGRSNALDRWNELNPSGFSYDLDHGTNARRNSGVYLEKEQRAFVDTYSMSFPKEDRARIFEYAMLPEMGHLFQPKIMQQKLRAICTGIREAYSLEEYRDPLPWEQYLE